MSKLITKNMVENTQLEQLAIFKEYLFEMRKIGGILQTYMSGHIVILDQKKEPSNLKESYI